MKRNKKIWQPGITIFLNKKWLYWILSLPDVSRKYRKSKGDYSETFLEKDYKKMFNFWETHFGRRFLLLQVLETYNLISIFKWSIWNFLDKKAILCWVGLRENKPYIWVWCRPICGLVWDFEGDLFYLSQLFDWRCERSITR